eukprot:Amastigsp_a846103_21.p2 type:complete len:106 gc:universal Amastigsp_a846103_21:159-476(+)
MRHHVSLRTCALRPMLSSGTSTATRRSPTSLPPCARPSNPYALLMLLAACRMWMRTRKTRQRRTRGRLPRPLISSHPPEAVRPSALFCVSLKRTALLSTSSLSMC